MAKLSSINKNERRKKLVKKYAGKYAKLKAIAPFFKSVVLRRHRFVLRVQFLFLFLPLMAFVGRDSSKDCCRDRASYLVVLPLPYPD